MIAAIVQGPIGRLVPVAFLMLSIQTTVLAELRPAGVALQLLLGFSAAVGVAGGPERGMLAGFVCGLLFDLGTGSPLGSSAITMGIGGLVGGTVAFVNLEIHWWLAALFVAAGTAAGELSVPVVRLFIGQQDVWDPRWYYVVPVVAVAAAVASPALVPIGRWCLRIANSEWKVPAA